MKLRWLSHRIIRAGGKDLPIADARHSRRNEPKHIVIAAKRRGEFYRVANAQDVCLQGRFGESDLADRASEPGEAAFTGKFAGHQTDRRRLQQDWTAR